MIPHDHPLAEYQPQPGTVAWFVLPGVPVNQAPLRSVYQNNPLLPYDDALCRDYGIGYNGQPYEHAGIGDCSYLPRCNRCGSQGGTGIGGDCLGCWISDVYYFDERFAGAFGSDDLTRIASGMCANALASAAQTIRERVWKDGACPRQGEDVYTMVRRLFGPPPREPAAQPVSIDRFIGDMKALVAGADLYLRLKGLRA